MLAVAIGCGGAQSRAADDLIVAVAGPMSGQYAAFGREMRAGVEAAVAGVVAAGGAGARRITVEVEDDGCDRSRAAAVARRLVEKKAAVVIGHHCAGASLAAAPVYAAAGIVMITPATSDPALTDKRAGPTIFRLAPRADREAETTGAYIARAFVAKRVAILHDRTVTGIALAEATRRAMRAAGLAEVLYSGFVAGEPSYTALARDLAALRIDAVYLGAYPNEVLLIQAALRRNEPVPAVIASTLLAGNASALPLDGLIVTTPAANIVRDAARAAVEAWATAADDGTAGARTAASLQAGTFDTVLGKVRFDRKGDAAAPFFEMRMWQGGTLVPAP